jgi:hypothetical protein
MIDGSNAISDDINRISSSAPSMDSVTAMADGAQQLLASANSHQLVFDPQVGQSLLKAINNAIDDLNDWTIDHYRRKFVYKLGLTAGGRAIAQFNDEVMATGANALAPAHQQFVENLGTMAEAVRIAIDNYARTEQNVARSFRAGH